MESIPAGHFTDRDAITDCDAEDGRIVRRHEAKFPSPRSILTDTFGLRGTSNNPFRRARTPSRSRSRSILRSYSLPRVGSRRYLRARSPVRPQSHLALPTPPFHTSLTENINPSTALTFHSMNPHTEGGPPPMLNEPHSQYPYAPYRPPAPAVPGWYLAPNQPLPAYPEPYPTFPSGPPVLAPNHPPTSDELKYKCSICGRFRSPRFHYKHPIPPGQLPAPTVCGKCRETGTDSEDSSEEEEEVVILPRGRRSRSLASLSQPIRRRVVTTEDSDTFLGKGTRVRSLSRTRTRSRSRPRGRFRRRSTSSSSLDSVDVEILEYPRRRGRSRSRGRLVERVQYVEESPVRRRSPSREVIYVEERARRRPRTDTYEEEYVTEYDTPAEPIPRR